MVRKPFRYSMRLLLVAITSLCVVFAILGWLGIGRGYFKYVVAFALVDFVLTCIQFGGQIWQMDRGLRDRYSMDEPWKGDAKDL
ncbi:MAG: hypothetical protein U0795_17935 [Pirellulales bacterium]